MVAERKRAEEALRESEERYRAVIEQSVEGMCLFDVKTGHIAEANPAFLNLLGYTAEEMRGLTLYDFVVLDRTTLDTALRRVAEHGEVFVGERIWRRKDGTVVDVQISSKRIHYRDRVMLVTMARSITERKRIEQAMRHREKIAEMGSLLAGVAHELNNPLSVVVGQAALLRAQAAGGPLGTRAEKIIQAAERCARIVRNFLALARQQPPEYQPVGLNVVVQEAIELLAYSLRVDNAEVRLDLAPDLPALRADPHQLHQVVINLAANAHQALREVPGPRRLTLTTRFDRDRQTVMLEVADTGPGIPREIRSRLFEPFFTTKPVGQGTGLGLALCQGIVEGHGGTIRFEDRPGPGATFRVELPVEAPPGTAPPGEVTPEPLITGRRILVVDDEPEVAAVLADMLRLNGQEVEAVTSGVEALAKLRHQAYDLILSDIKMPGLGGPDLYRELTAQHPEMCERIVFLTGDALGPETLRFIEETGAPHLAKPFAMADVRRVVQSLRAS